ncbi:STXBP4 isoform 7, partial [Pan troglodytes]
NSAILSSCEIKTGYNKTVQIPITLENSTVGLSNTGPKLSWYSAHKGTTPSPETASTSRLKRDSVFWRFCPGCQKLVLLAVG